MVSRGLCRRVTRTANYLIKMILFRYCIVGESTESLWSCATLSTVAHIPSCCPLLVIDGARKERFMTQY